ncbi:MAG: cytochrome c biogenesis CcdA family protein [Brevinematia bacterium]
MSLLIAISGGILTFLSPCILPLIPVYITYITGLSVSELKEEKLNKSGIIINSLAFVAGFTTVFTIMAVLLFILSAGYGNIRIWFSRIGGIIVVLFGLHLTGILNIKFLNFQLKADVNTKSFGILNSLLIGMSFGGGWTPCVGPVLSGILVLSTQSSKIYLAILQLIFYSLGIGIPFILTAFFLDRAISFFNVFKKHSKTIEIISGVFLIVLGVLLFTGWINRIIK